MVEKCLFPGDVFYVVISLNPQERITLNCENMKNDRRLLVQLLLSSTHLALTIFHISLPPSLLLCVSVRQLSGLLPGTLHERTGGSTFLLNIALHSGDSLPCLCLCPLFVFVHFCVRTSKSSSGLHFHRRLTSSCLLLFLSDKIISFFFFAQMQWAMHYFALMT